VALKATGWLYGSANTAQQELSTAEFMWRRSEWMWVQRQCAFEILSDALLS